MDINKEKIDLVYAWVDNNDFKWLEKKMYWQTKENINMEGNSDCRYINNDELKYSLRSVEKYANWINRIFIITPEIRFVRFIVKNIHIFWKCFTT